jgi:hypothetical protein
MKTEHTPKLTALADTAKEAAMKELEGHTGDTDSEVEE